MFSFYSKDFYDNNLMSINASIIDKCNYTCQYCCNKFPRTEKLMDLNILVQFINYIKTLTIKNIQITLIGGEVMLHPDIYVFCKEMEKINISCILYSNFSFPYKFYDKFGKNVQFTMSWHKSKTDIFMQNISLIPNNKLNRYTFYVMYEHNNIQESINVFNYIKHKTNKVSLKKIFNTYNYQYEYDQYQLSLFNKITKINIDNNITAEDIYILNEKDNKKTITNIKIDESINPFKHWKCYAGLDNLHITEDGDIYPCCTLQPLDDYKSKYKIGNIKKCKNFKLKPILLCQASRCCNYEIKKDNILNKNYKINI